MVDHVLSSTSAGACGGADRGLREVPAAPETGVVQPRRGDAAADGPPSVAPDEPGRGSGMASRRRCAPSTSGIPIHRRSTASRSIVASGRTGRAGARTIHLVWPAQTLSGRPCRSSIAGCGTSQAAKHALRWPAAQVTGIDFSATSVRRTEELKRKYDLDNLQVHQLADRARQRAGATFDQIVCTGVLHHLADPDAGLAALRDVLRPDGAMHLMVYAPYGRTGIYMLQEFCRRLGIARDRRRDSRSRRGARRAAARPSAGNAAARGAGLPASGGARRRAAAPAGPRLLGAATVRVARTGRAAVRPLGQAGPLQPALRRHGAPPAGCAARGASPRRAVRRRRAVSGHDASPQRDRVPGRRRRGHRRPACFFRGAGDAWESTVPIRMPDTIAVEENLPADTAAVLINRNHTFDGHLPADRRAGEAALRRHRRDPGDRRHRPDRRGARCRARPVPAALLVRPGRLRRVRGRAPIRATLRRRRDSNPRRFRATVFKTVAFDHSATPPVFFREGPIIPGSRNVTTRRRARC